MITERQITIVTRTCDPGDDTGVQVFLRTDHTDGGLIDTGIKAPDHATAARLVAAKLSGTA